MGIVDIIIIILLLLYVAKGFSDGVIRESVSFIGGFVVVVLAFFIKNPVSVFLYKTLPFFKFSGPLAGISVANIIVYELIAFLLVAGILLMIYGVVVKATRIFENILKLTIVLAIPSKILGAIIGFIEGVTVTFILLFVFMQFNFTKNFIDKSNFATTILTKTPLLGSAIDPIYTSFKEIYEVSERYNDDTNRDEANLEGLDILLKYEVLSAENAEDLVESGKLDIPGAKELIAEYK